METHILGNSIALDQWAKLNPVGFEYDYDYLANAQRDGSEFCSRTPAALWTPTP